MKKAILSVLAVIASISNGALAADGLELTFQQAKSQLNSGDFDQALSSFDRCLKQNSNCLQARWYKAAILGKMGDYARARDEFSNLLVQAPDNAALYRARAGMYLFLQQYDKALNDCNKSISLNPNDGKAYDFRGAAHLHLGMTDKAEEDKQKALELDSASVNVMENSKLPMYGTKQTTEVASANQTAVAAKLAMVQSSEAASAMSAGDFNQAWTLFNKILKVEPGNLEYKRNRAICLARLGRHQEAIEDLTILIKQNGSMAELYALRAESYQALNRNKEALNDLDKAIKLDARLAAPHKIKARILLAARQPDQALSELEQAIRLAPRNSELYQQSAEIYLSKSDLKKATQYFSQSLVLNPANSASYLGRALCYERNKQFKYALDDYGNAIRFQNQKNQDNKAVEGRMRSAFELKQYARVIEDANGLLASKPANEEALLLMRARSYEALNSKEKCLQDLNAIIKKNPGNLEAVKERSRITLSEPSGHLDQAANNQALEDLNKLLAGDRNNQALLLKRMQLLKNLSRPEQIIEDAGRLLSLNANSEVALESRAQAYMVLARYQEAEADLSTLLRSKPNANYFKLRAACLQKLGKESLAVRDLEMATDLEKKIGK